MISKNKIAFIVSLQKKRTRDEERLFVIEGDKLVKEFIEAKAKIRILVALPEFLNTVPLSLRQEIDEIIEVTNDDLKKISSLTTPHNALAVIEMNDQSLVPADLKKELVIALDCVQDPGNLGTIIRSAAWFGLNNIFCSEDCADVFNPKVIQASMGAVLHVKVHYGRLVDFFKSASEAKTRIYGAVMAGESIYSLKLDPAGIILLGNESKGISEVLMQYVTDRIMIPKITREQHGIDSLNVSMAASVILSEFTRSRGREF